MPKQGKQNLIQGAAVLGIAMLVVKLLGAVFKITVLKQMDASGSAYFNAAYNFFTPIYALAIGGLPTAIARIVASLEEKGRFRDVKKTLRISVSTMVVVGLVGSIAMAMIARVYIHFSGVGGAYLATVMVAPALFFLCVTSALRGYYEGLGNMRPTAISEVVEVIAKVVFGLVIVWVVIKIGNDQFAATGSVFGQQVVADRVGAVIMPYAAAAAVFGVTLSCVAGMFYMIVRYRKQGDGITRKQLVEAPRSTNGNAILKELVRIAIPISIGVFVLNLVTLIDTMTVTNIMNNSFTKNADKITEIFGKLVPVEDFNADKFGTYIYGCFGYAFSVFNLIPAFTGIFAKSALPNVVRCWETRDRRGMKINVESGLRLASFIAIPAGIGLFVLAGPVLRLLYSDKAVEVYITTPAMELMGLAIIFLGIVTPAFAILQAMNKAYVPVKLMVIGSVIKIAINQLMIGIPSVNLAGAAWGTLACYAYIFIASMYEIRKAAKIKINYMTVFIRPLIAGIACGITAWQGYMLLAPNNGKPSTIATLGSVVLAGGVYVVVLVLVKGISRDDLMMIPKGDKIAEKLEKMRLLG